MKTAVLLVCVVALVAETAAEKYHKRVGIPTAARIRLQESMRITGGVSSYPGEHPFFAGLIITLKSGQTSVCGGALVRDNLVVTIAQCWYDGESEGREMQVVLGTNKLYSGGIRNYANWTVVHPEYDPDNLANDVAVARIPSVRQYTNVSDFIKPILLNSYSDTFEDYLAQMIGFGKTTPNAELNGSASLRDAYVKIMGNTACNSFYGSTVKSTSYIICTRGDKKRGACAGDYGGPLILRRFRKGQDLLVGLVSLTSAAGCDAGHPTGHTRISKYIYWINNF